MQGSPFPAIARCTTLVLASGHGDKDPGACHAGFREADEAIIIVDSMAAILRERGLRVVVAPHKHDTHQTIPWINKQYRYGDALAVEVHRDSAEKIAEPDASLRCGFYHGNSLLSKDVARLAVAEMKRMGAHSSSWARPQSEHRAKSLAWIRQINCFSLLLELGFMEGRHDAAHLQTLARIGAASLLKIFSGGTLPGPESARH